jgi:hypothetical protein
LRVHAVRVSTAGNQSYIYGSAKRRENVGASHLITCVEGSWLDGALAAVGGRGDARAWRVDEHGIEVVTANAGGVLLLVRDKAVGREIVGLVTEAALRDAPGLDVCGAVGESFEWGGSAEFERGAATARGLLSVARSARRGPKLRFPGLPIAARCTSSGLPAANILALQKKKEARGHGEPAEDRYPRSEPSLAKRKVFDAALERLAVKMGLCEEDDEPGRSAARGRLDAVVDYLGDTAEWVAVVHADVNGLGRVFQEFGKLDHPSARAHVNSLRNLSGGVDDCAGKAFRTVVADLKEEKTGQRVRGELALLPLVLGGDDLTVVCEGAIALPFARRYLEAFAREADDHPNVGVLLKRDGGASLGASAGVAIVKRHYPFHSAVDLAEELTKEAKHVKTGLGSDRCALSFHVLYESAHADLGRLRKEHTLREDDGSTTVLTAQPYVVGDPKDDPGGWAVGRRWDDLCARVGALTASGADGKRTVSAAQAHDLRGGLFGGRKVTDARFTALSTWVGAEAVADLAGAEGSLFWDDGRVRRTGLLDALDAAPFIGERA